LSRRKSKNDRFPKGVWVASAPPLDYTEKMNAPAKGVTKEVESMKHTLAVVLAVGLLFSTCFAAEKPAPTSQKSKESYSMGYQFGQGAKANRVDIDADAYASGLRDSLGGAKPALSQEEMQDAVSGLQKRVMATQQKEMAATGEKNLAAGKAFMDENKKKPGVKTLPSGLQYKVITEGSGKSPKETDQVTVNYKGTLITGTEFDSSYKRGQPATFPVKGVIPGWTEALQKMKEGAKWQLVVPPELAYGSKGMGPIPPNSTLVFEVELISVK
jgi:FKBP-type peptidyl-prolyl cis-trans isomerase FklB